MYGLNYNYQQPVYQQQIQQPQQDERIWVQNQQCAESYLVAPNAFVRLWDSQRPVFYEKRADATGRPFPVECYKYEKIAPSVATYTDTPTNNYDEQLKALNQRILAIEKEIHNEQSNADDTDV